MTRPTRRGAALLAVALATYVAARVLGTWELYLIALALAGLVVAGWALVAGGSRRLAVHRRVDPEHPVAGDQLRFEFTAETWRLPGLRLVLEGATAGVPEMPDPVVVDDAGVRGRPFIVGPLPARRGVYHLQAFTASVEDPLGLVRVRRPAGAPLRLTVPPRLEELASCAPCSQKGVRQGGGRRRLPTRDAWEFRAVRPHVPGEPLERVDWKSTAKTGNLMLREMEADTEDDVTLLLDAPPHAGGAARHTGGLPDEAFETAVVAAGSMAAFTLRSGHAASLLLPDTGWRELRLSPDAASHRLLLAALAETRPQGSDSLGPSLPSILGAGRQRRRRLVLVTTRVDAGLARALGKLRAQGARVSVVHVLEDGAALRAAGRAPDDPGPLVAAAGARYYPLSGPSGVHDALSSRTADRTVRAR